MPTHFVVAVIAALIPGAVVQQSPTRGGGSPTALVPTVLVPAVIVHCGDHELLERLKVAGEIWYDSSEFLVGALSQRDLAELEAAGVSTHAMLGVGPEDELFFADLEHTDLRVDIDASARLEFRHGTLGVVSVAAERHDDPERPRAAHTCSSPHTAIARRAMAPLQALPAPNTSTNPGIAALSGPNAQIQALVDGVKKANLEAFVQSYSTGYVNRASTNFQNYGAAKAQLIAELVSYGYAPQQEMHNPQHEHTVFVDIPGTVSMNEYVVIGAHFDTLNYAVGPSGLCPGADDNTSGSAGVLEIARVLSTAGSFEKSIRLVWFSGEELGLIGSTYHASRMDFEGKQAIAMFNMDMIAYRDPSDARDVDFATNNTSPALTTFCLQTCPLYVANWAATTGPFLTGNSDHASFNQVGVPAVIFREDFTLHFPNRHTPLDAYPNSTTDFDLAEMIVRGVMACATTLAEPVSVSIAHTELPDSASPFGPYIVQASVSSATNTSIAAVTLNYRTRGSTNWTNVAMSNTVGSDWSGLIPTLGSALVVEYFIEATDAQGDRDVAPAGANFGQAPFDFFVGARTPLYTTSFEETTDNGWTHGFTATEDDWERGTPMGLGGDAASAFSGNKAWGNDLGNAGDGRYSSNVDNWLQSPSVDCSAADRVWLEFRRWLAVDSRNHDLAQILVNGQVVWNSPHSLLLDSSWVPMQLDISAVAANEPAVQVMFRLTSNNGLNFGGWNIDDFALIRVESNEDLASIATYCTAKLNSDGCLARISTSGLPSASSPTPFTIRATDVVGQKSGVLFYGNASFSAPFQGGVRCVAPPMRRCSPQVSGGSPPPNVCTGVLSFDFNERIRAGADPALVVGANVFAQWWYRDGADPAGFGSGLSDGVRFTICQ